MLNLGLDVRRLSQVGVVFLKEDRFTNTVELRIYGCEILDLMDAVKYNIYKNPPDYSLNTCGNFFLGEEKEKVESVVELWEKNIDFLVKYNKKDVELCVKLDEVLGLVSYYNAIQRILPMPLQEIDFKSKIVDYYILRKYKYIAFPSKHRSPEAKVEGGFVKEPKSGLFKNVIILDVSSMYPNIYITFNISHDTLSKEGTTDLNGHHFISRHKKMGLIPGILADLLVERYKIKAERDKSEKGSAAYRMLDERQTALKEVMNSFYGVMALPSYRLFNPIIANSVTFVGRSMIKWAIRYVEEHSDVKVLYTDTDSIFIKLPDELSQDESISLGNKIKDAVNSHLSLFCADFNLEQKDSALSVPKRLLSNDTNLHTLAFEFEKYFSAIIFTGAKKKYMGLVKWQDGKSRDEVYARGFETIRADTPLPIKSLLLEVYKDILSFKSESSIVDKINSRFDSIMRNIAVYELASAKYINKEINEYVVKPQHVRAAEYSNKHLGTTFGKSTKPRIIYIKRVPQGYPKAEVIAVSETLDIRALGFTIDHKKYKRKLLLDKLKEVFKIMNWRDLDQDAAQLRLDSVFK
jgi:DNA polymerase elongation subunit (family B)